MSGEKNMDMFQSPQPTSSIKQIDQGSPGTFVLSPETEIIKEPSYDLKLIKYQKLYKLYQKELQKRDVTRKLHGLEQRKEKYDSLVQQILPTKTPRKNHSNSTENMESKLKALHTQRSEQTVRGEEVMREKSQQLMKIQATIRQQHSKEHLKNVQNSNRLEHEITKQVIRKTQLDNKLHKINTFSEQIKYKIRHQKEQNTSSKEKYDQSNIQELNDSKQNLRANLDSIINQINGLQSHILNSLSKNNENSVNEAELKQLQNKLTGMQSQKNRLQTQINKLREEKDKAKKNQQTINKNIQKLEKQHKQADERVKRIEKEENQTRTKLEKAKQQTKEKDIELPVQYKDLIRKNQKIKSEIDHLQSLLAVQRKNQKDLVPPVVLETHQKKIEQAKQYYQKNKQIGYKIKNTDAEVQKLSEEKESLEWDINPTVKNLGQSQITQTQRIKDLQQEVKTLLKQSNQVSNKLEEYTKEYPDFEFERKKPKKVVKKEEDVKKQESKKKDEKDDKQNKKGKNTSNKSPESAKKKNKKK